MHTVFKFATLEIFSSNCDPYLVSSNTCKKVSEVAGWTCKDRYILKYKAITIVTTK